SLDPGDHVGDREGLARAGDPEQHLGRLTVVQALDQLGDRLRLAAARLELADQLERSVGGDRRADRVVEIPAELGLVDGPGFLGRAGGAAAGHRRKPYSDAGPKLSGENVTFGEARGAPQGRPDWWGTRHGSARAGGGQPNGRHQN